MRVSKRKWQGLFKVLVGCFSLAGPVKAETFVVTNLADQGEGSLRAAITEANTTNAPDLILFSDGSDGSLNFQDGLTRIIPVNSTLVVSAPLEIIGPGQDALVLDGGGDDDFLIETGETRIFSFTGSTNTNPHRIRALTIQNGSSLLGGANIRVLGSFEIFDCIVQGGRAAASAPNIFSNNNQNADGGGLFHSAGNLLVENCQFLNNATFGNFSQGGALYSENGNATLRGCRIVNNTTMGQVSEGGGVAFRSDTLMENCEISDNETLSPFSGGGGIYTDDDFVARQCTISGNLVGRFTGIDGYSVGGAFANVASGDATFEHCTIVNNFAPPGQGQGGGISSLSSGEISFFGSILIGNDAVDLERIPQASTRVSDLGFNFFGTGEGFNLILNRAPTSVYGISSADGILADLAFNGGKTRTHRLVTSTTSSQINAVDAGPTLLEVMAANLDGAPFLFEQRGGDFPRIVNGRLDIGAYEFQTFIDSDDDGLPDAVEQIVSGLDPSVADANDDLDGDSLSNLDEYLLSGIAAMSDPALRFKVQMTQALSEQEMRLSFPASENREYRVLQSSNLALNFTAIAPDYTRFLSTGTQTLSAPATAPRLFFRIEGQVPSELQETDSP